MYALHLAFLVTLPIFMAVLHRLRGGGFIKLPFKLTYYLAIPVGLWTWGAGASWPAALVLGLGYELWCLPAWMQAITSAEDAVVPSDQITSQSWDARVLRDIGFGNGVLECFLRAGVFLVPMLVALGLLDRFGAVVGAAAPLYDLAPFALIVFGFLPAYLIGYKFNRAGQSSIAEPLVGLLWGVAMTGFIMLA